VVGEAGGGADAVSAYDGTLSEGAISTSSEGEGSPTGVSGGLAVWSSPTGEPNGVG